MIIWPPWLIHTRSPWMQFLDESRFPREQHRFLNSLHVFRCAHTIITQEIAQPESEPFFFFLVRNSLIQPLAGKPGTKMMTDGDGDDDEICILSNVTEHAYIDLLDAWATFPFRWWWAQHSTIKNSWKLPPLLSRGHCCCDVDFWMHCLSAPICHVLKTRPHPATPVHVMYEWNRWLFNHDIWWWPQIHVISRRTATQ